MKTRLIAGKSLQDWLDRADELGRAGHFFDAHEQLETAWSKASGDVKILLQGLIQIAAGLHRLRLDPSKVSGAHYLLERGARKLRAAQSLLVPGSLATLESKLAAIKKSGTAPAALTFGLRAITFGSAK